MEDPGKRVSLKDLAYKATNPIKHINEAFSNKFDLFSVICFDSFYPMDKNWFDVVSLL